MPSFDFSRLNATVVTLFGDPCTYIPVGPMIGSTGSTGPTPPPPSFQITLINKDPLRREDTSPGNFAIRFGKQADFDGQGYAPKKGDKVVLETGLPYLVEDVQADGGQGYDLVLKKTR